MVGNIKKRIQGNLGKIFILGFLLVFILAYNSLGSNATLADAQYSPNSVSGRDIVLSFAGDVHAEKPIDPSLGNDKNSYNQIKEIFSSSDINIINLETALTNQNVKRIKKYNFKIDPTFALTLKSLGVNVVSIANNHSFDYGAEGFRDTIDGLNKYQLNFVGGGLSQAEAYKPLIIDVRGVKIAILGFAKVNGGPGSLAYKFLPGTTDGYNEKLTKDAVLLAKSQADYVVILTHWGEENSTSPRTLEIESGRKWLSYGADLIVGSHPHVLQPIKRFGDKEIAYSLGNFIFYSHSNLNNKTGIYQVRLDASGKFMKSNFIPMTINSTTGMPSLTR